MIPIVFTMATDPLEDGLVASYNRPGGNVTGVVLFSSTLGPKKLEILRELIPGTSVIGFLSNPRNEIARGQLKDIDEAARAVGQRIAVVRASTPPELDSAFAELAALGAGALLISADPFYQLDVERLVALARYAQRKVGCAWRKR